VKYWEIIADNLSKAGFSWGCVSAIDSSGRTIWVADAHRDRKRFIVRPNEVLSAFLELEQAIHQFAVSSVLSIARTSVRADEKLTGVPWPANRQFAVEVAEIPATFRAYENNRAISSRSNFTCLLCRFARDASSQSTPRRRLSQWQYGGGFRSPQ
jgi:hypothetical protein